MKIVKKQIPTKRPLGHGIFPGTLLTENVEGEQKVRVDFPGTGCDRLDFKKYEEFDEETRTGHELKALFGDEEVPDEVTPELLNGKTAYFVLVVERMAGGKPKPKIETILSEEMVNRALELASAVEATPKTITK
jgi:hypothetical protein